MAQIECISLYTGNTVEIPEESVLCLGNFDGVHLAHRTLLQTALQLRDQVHPNAVCGVFCFREHSADYLSNSSVPHLCTTAQKLERFRDIGMDVVFLADFPSIRSLSPQAFVQTVLKDLCHCVGAVCGFNYRFGKNAMGTAQDLSALLDAPVRICDEFLVDGQTVSSTQIRTLLANGDVEHAAKLLTLPYSITAPVIHGKALGRKLGTPTVNQAFPKGLQIPKHGVYLTDCRIGQKHYRGVTNVGVRPTVDIQAQVNCETYLLDFTGDVYGEEIETSFLRFLRPEQKFQNQEELRNQILLDIEAAKQF
ncbi:MAG: bifunctional riboflavin kinase/FAD synthetase [Clostridia bacterium]|nr:bifunctional riboflavin kinase/FAD synthetase [Clostridia bacterium]